MTLRAPFPWFGGKRRCAEVVWRAFGDVPNYVEPFFGSGAVLLGRPSSPRIETINDADCWVANFWRAITLAPADVAHWADWPVNEVDLHARHKWLVSRLEFRERMRADPEYFDARIAVWWVWGLCQWIGGGWCVEPNNHKHPRLDGKGKGVHGDQGAAPREQLPDLGVTGDKNGNVGTGKGVHASGMLRRDERESGQHFPYLRVNPTKTQAGQGVHAEGLLNRSKRGSRDASSEWAQRPTMTGNTHGMGVHGYSPGRRPAMTAAGSGVHRPNLGTEGAPCEQWFHELAARLRRVRVACGDWTRVMGPSVLGKGKDVGGRRPCAVFLDPPYSHEFRDPYLYAEDDADVSARVREWALEHGDDPDLRIALCGYEDEHQMPATWQVYQWKASRGYAGDDNENRAKERIWFSPHCLPIDQQPSLFGDARSA